MKNSTIFRNYKLLSDSKSKSSLIVDLKYHNGLPVIKEITATTWKVIPGFKANP